MNLQSAESIFDAMVGANSEDAMELASALEDAIEGYSLALALFVICTMHLSLGKELYRDAMRDGKSLEEAKEQISAIQKAAARFFSGPPQN